MVFSVLVSFYHQLFQGHRFTEHMFKSLTYLSCWFVKLRFYLEMSDKYGFTIKILCKRSEKGFYVTRIDRLLLYKENKLLLSRSMYKDEMFLGDIE